jgi:vacuolar-type H+-ATPase subunit H
MTGTDLMTRSDRETLIKIARQRERLAKTEAKERAALLIADFEKQLDKRYHYNDNAIWSEATKIAKATVKEAQKRVSDECTRLGIPKEFAPQLSLGWAERGRNDSEKQRSEMRRVAMKTVDALEKSARTAIERRSLETQEKIMVGGLTSDDARLFLAAMPTAEALMPELTVDKVEVLLLGEKAA